MLFALKLSLLLISTVVRSVIGGYIDPEKGFLLDNDALGKVPNFVVSSDISLCSVMNSES